MTQCQSVCMRAKESTKQRFTDIFANLSKVGDCAMYDLERFVLHNDFIGLLEF